MLWRVVSSTLMILALLLSPMPAMADGQRIYLPLTKADAPRDAHWGYCTRVVDGDTVEVTLDDCQVIPSFRVRLIGVDTPERGECFFTEATERTRALVGGQRVLLQRDTSERDGFGRLLRYVYTEDGRWVGGALVREGYAQVAIYPPDDRYSPRLYWLEGQARAENAGGWGEWLTKRELGGVGYE